MGQTAAGTDKTIPNAGGSVATAAPPSGLDAVFRPRSVAVIGASSKPGTIGSTIFHNLLARGFAGPAYPVHPTALAVHSVRAYPRIEDVPRPVDLAIIVVPARSTVEVLESCGRTGVGAAVVISAGFKETGEEGDARQSELVAVARRYGMRLVGPNCLGVLNTEPGVSLQATFAPTFPPRGNVAFSTQSGALGLAILDLAAELNIGISHFASVGNKADVSGNDLIEYWEHDPLTEIILLYLESFGNPRRFIEVARRVSRRKPIIAVKSGRTEAGARAASSHTGSLAGADAAVDALCRQSGVIRTDTMEQMFDVAMLLANQPVPCGPRVGIVTNAGGPGIMASDALEGHGLEVPALEESTVARLREFLPAEASTRNPVDMIASARPDSFEKAIELVAGDPNVDAVLAIYVPPIVTRPLEVAQAIVRGAARAVADANAAGRVPKPVLSCFLGTHGVPEGLQSLHQGKIPSYRFPENAALALTRAVHYGQWRGEPVPSPVRFDDVRADEARRVVDAAHARSTAGAGAGGDSGENRGVWLRPDEVEAVLSAYGIPLPAFRFASNAGEAVEAARTIGFPVALKLVSETITHKSDVGGVALELRDADDVRAAFSGIRGRANAEAGDSAFAGVIVQPMVRGGLEAIVGVTRDPSFGPLVMFGLGGVDVEVLRDVAFRIHPLTRHDAERLVREVRGHRLMGPYRGRSARDAAAVEDVLLRVSQLVGDLPALAEIDLNPLVVFGRGNGCCALDARMLVRA